MHPRSDADIRPRPALAPPAAALPCVAAQAARPPAPPALAMLLRRRRARLLAAHDPLTAGRVLTEWVHRHG